MSVKEKALLIIGICVGISFGILLMNHAVTYAQTVSTVTSKAVTLTEKCERFHIVSMVTLGEAEDEEKQQNAGLSGIYYSKSAAYGIAYQNCVLRNK